MQRVKRVALLVAAALAWAGASRAVPALAAGSAPTHQALTPFGTERNLARFLAKVTEEQRRIRLRVERESERRRRSFRRRHERLVKEREKVQRRQGELGAEQFTRELKRLDEELFKLQLSGGLTETVQTSTAAATRLTSITNLQDPGVDEGGLIKRHGDHLVILRRGRLFTVAIGGDELRAIAAVDAFDPRIELDVNDRSTWYDELLVSGNTVVVLGYSYERGGTEIGLFDVDSAGSLRHRATYHLRSSDYYTAENYSSRLIGTKLVIYTSSWFDGENQPRGGLPELRRWNPSATEGEFQRIAATSRVYRPARRLDVASGVILHSVTSCDLASAELVCEASVVIGDPQVTFYVSRSAVYVWTDGFRQAAARSESMVYRIPVGGSPPTALRVRGTPFDQFSFLESADGFLNVVVGGASDGEQRSAAVDEVDISLLRVELGRLADGSTSAPQSAYSALTRCTGGAIENRFVGAHLLVSCGSPVTSAEAAADSMVSIVRWGTQETVQLAVPLWVARLEPMGEHALAAGPGPGWGDLSFATIRLDSQPAPADTFTFTGTAQSEHRSHAFAYMATDATDGLLGLPVVSVAGEHTQGAGAVVFLRSRSLMLEDAGVLAAGSEPSDDACRASCVDWYGNARPLFIGDRVFALLGYEIVEGTMAGDRLMERRRSTFAPQGLLQ